MNRIEFMRQLERLLQNIPEAERAEALQYYNDYFDDAGVESEKEVIDALGNPAKVAENIKRDLYGDEAVQSSVKHPPMKYQDISNTQQQKEKKKVEGGLFAHIGACMRGCRTGDRYWRLLDLFCFHLRFWELHPVLLEH